MLIQFSREEECLLSREIPGEVAVVELLGKKWTIRLNGSATTASNGVGIMLSYEDERTIPFSFKLEYEAYPIGLAIALSIRVKHIRVLRDSNLVVSQVRGYFSLRESSLASYHAWAQKIERKF